MPLNKKENERYIVADFYDAGVSAQANNTHLEGPHSSNPHLKRSIDSLDILQVDAFPPAPPRRLAPEEKELLGHANGVVVHVVAADIAAQSSQGKTAHDRFVGLTGTMTPAVVMIEATATC